MAEPCRSIYLPPLPIAASPRRSFAASRVGYVLLLLTLLVVPACQMAPRPPATAPGDAQAVLREVLPELAKAHRDKTQLAFYATSIFRRVDPPVKQFAQQMGQEQQQLLDELQVWSKAHQIDLKFRFSDDVFGAARKAMEKEQGDMIQADNNVDFQRDMLVLMYTDYSWQYQLVSALLPTVQDPQLKRYLQKSQHVHEAGTKQIRQLLGKYKYVP